MVVLTTELEERPDEDSEETTDQQTEADGDTFDPLHHLLP